MIKVLLTFIVFQFFTIFAGAEDSGYPVKPFTSPEKWIKGDWEYEVYYIYKGTSKEGMNGFLMYRGHHVRPVFPRDYVRTPFGGMTFLPAATTIGPNALMGWHYADFDKIPWTTPNHPVFKQRHDWHEAAVIINW
jgi:hypothetical protein